MRAVLLALLALLAAAHAANLIDTAFGAGLTSLTGAIFNVGLDGALNGTGPFTVFAPTNDAFTAANLGGASTAAVTAVLQYHVLSGKYNAANFTTNGQGIATLQGERVFINVAGGNVYVNGIQVVTPDVAADNGVAHVIGTVLSIPTNNIAGVATATASVSTLVSLLPNSVVTTLSGTGPFTLFAPTNAAFAAVPQCLLNYLNTNASALLDVLNYHVLAFPVFGAAVANGTAQTAQGASVTTQRIGSTVRVNGATVTTPDVLATNGVIHLIDQVLLPPTVTLALACKILDVANANGLTSLTGATTAAGLNATLDGTGPFTVFAPTNAAFAALGASAPTGQALANTLLYHVVPARATSGTLVDNSVVATALTGKSVIVNKKTSGVYVNGVQVTTADVLASNGVAHVIDKVLSIPTDNLLGTAALAARFATLASLVRAAGPNLGATLNGTGPFTVFAPNDTAFAALPESLVNYLLDNTTALSEVLTYHVLSGAFFSSFLTSGTATTVQGSGLAINVGAGGVTVGSNGARVLTADILATNGVIHEISSVLVPAGLDLSSSALAPAVSALLLIAAAVLVLFQ